VTESTRESWGEKDAYGTQERSVVQNKQAVDQGDAGTKEGVELTGNEG